ncbi:MAG: AMP-binding protein [Armatimonadota bacterium]|nr:AMP-binding protein [Armatimonadota bacterium]MDR7520175.1 AMP-binding protein [Armatimonadota bacterium]MDR7549250.1 AMP-binding protein [Armatimonadota bacterium]
MDEVWHPAERWGEPKRLSWQERRLREVVLAALPHAPALRERLAGAGLRPQGLTLAEVGGLPVLRKDSLPEAQRQTPPFGGWLGVPLQDLGRVFRSPGPIFDPEGRQEDYWRFAPALFAAGLRPGDLVLNTLSYHLTPAGHMFDSALRALGCPVIPSGPGGTETQVQVLASLPVVGYVGTPSFLATVLEAAAASGARVGLRVAFVIAEMLPESLRGRLEERYGVRISQGYGTADLGSVAYECVARSGMHVWYEHIVELVDPHSGEPAQAGAPGEVVVTTLNPVYPLLRFGTGDLAVMAEGPCPCGRPGPRLARILGRVGEAVKVRGMFVHPAEVDRIVARHPEAARYQVVVSRTGHQDDMLVRVEVRSDAAVPPDLRDRLRQSLTEGLRLRCDVELVAAGALEADARKIVDRRRWE